LRLLKNESAVFGKIRVQSISERMNAKKTASVCGIRKKASKLSWEDLLVL
jgi:hypothetical protein